MFILVVYPVAAAALLLTFFYVAANKEYFTKRQIIFKCVNLAFPRLYCLKFLFKLTNVSRSYEENKTVTFFSFTVYTVRHKLPDHLALIGIT